MKNKLLISAFLLGIATHSQAGLWDSLFGGGEKKAEAETTSEQVASPKEQNKSASTTMEQAGALTGLVPLITSQLGVTNKQAQGGMGSLMQLAQGTLSEGEFGQLSQGVPGMDALLAAAPAIGGSNLGNMLSNAGGLASNLGGISQVTKQFEALGLSSDMVLQFATLAIGYFTNNDSTPGEGELSTAGLLEKGLGAILG